MKIIAVLNEKGGVGKTTIATNLSRGLQLMGHRTLLVDSDPQGSARDWHAAAQDGSTLPPVVGMDRPSLFKNLKQVAQDFDWTVIDGSPRVEELAVASIKIADFVLIPVQPSPYDIWAAESLVDLVKTRREIAEGKPGAGLLISRQIVGTKLAGEARAALEGYQLPILSSLTSQRVIYAQSASRGSTVLDDEPNGAAAEEIRAVIKEIVSWS
ncbi:MAG: ParA family partition ATPase [Candidatus Competibacter denitrificans]|jgi:chromosome partitioning protein